ncbi:hypothetical protein LEP1GSC193_4471 [Leptospira alstonii serovar Pingchang str. 80-412]|uniref:Uncharacterized protein n=2 Tax=Leptospira alstonii TaxID=28452 RepID=M6CVN5_9LEPT|nr:hypothetical protein LEP1GSC194_0004 [Leptospira alstonii serovar Sichuan str. 79601]EQA80368.1 hypothetical protein LEP1GSC193_4471 [Leptospira alstonii serovar Pingchang str. 80-412]
MPIPNTVLGTGRMDPICAKNENFFKKTEELIPNFARLL